LTTTNRALNVGGDEMGFPSHFSNVSAKNFSLYVCAIFRCTEVSGKSGRQYRIYVHCGA